MAKRKYFRDKKDPDEHTFIEPKLTYVVVFENGQRFTVDAVSGLDAINQFYEDVYGQKLKICEVFVCH
jgi:hypothetical protein